MFNRFEKVRGMSIDKIIGQERFAFTQTDYIGFYDMIEYSKKQTYQGSSIAFYDFFTGKVYEPFEKTKNVLYGNPVYIDGYFYFLKGDYNDNTITLLKHFPDTLLETVEEFKMSEMDLYNLGIIGNPLYIISQDNETFNCYYPKRISFPLNPNETVFFIENEKIYLEAWQEEEFDKEKWCATKDYKYYDKITVKDFKGNTISEEIGSLYQAPDGNWWIS